MLSSDTIEFLILFHFNMKKQFMELVSLQKYILYFL